MDLLLILLIAVFCAGAKAAKYPSDLPQCKHGDETCLPGVITDIVRSHPEGHTGLSIPPLEPLRINSIDILQGGNGPVVVNLHFKNLDLTGVKGAVATKVVGFDKDPHTSKYEVHAKVPKLRLHGDYKINGRVLVLPIVGNGKATLVFDDVELIAKYTPTVVEKKGRDYIQTGNIQIQFETSRLRINLTNLFNGDKALGDNMNVFLNENWRLIFDELKPSVVYAFEEVLKGIMNRIFAKVPYADLFLPE